MQIVEASHPHVVVRNSARALERDLIVAFRAALRTRKVGFGRTQAQVMPECEGALLEAITALKWETVAR